MIYGNERYGTQGFKVLDRQDTTYASGALYIDSDDYKDYYRVEARLLTWGANTPSGTPGVSLFFNNDITGGRYTNTYASGTNTYIPIANGASTKHLIVWYQADINRMSSSGYWGVLWRAYVHAVGSSLTYVGGAGYYTQAGDLTQINTGIHTYTGASNRQGEIIWMTPEDENYNLIG